VLLVEVRKLLSVPEVRLGGGGGWCSMHTPRLVAWFG